MPDETLTAEEIQANYDAALDSVTLINELMALESRDDEQTASVARNVEHLQINHLIHLRFVGSLAGCHISLFMTDCREELDT